MIRRNSQRASRTYRRLAPQVMRPRLRPCWRIAIKIQIVLALLSSLVWAAGAVGTALAEHAIKDMDAKLEREWDKAIQAALERERDKAMQAELKRDQERARSAALNNDYVPGDEQLCELLYGRDVAVCDRATLQRLAEEAAHKRLKPSQDPLRRANGTPPTSRRETTSISGSRSGQAATARSSPRQTCSAQARPGTSACLHVANSSRP